MTTLADLRGRLRTLLGDNAAEGYLWSDSALALHLGDAVRSYGRHFPLEKELVITTLAEQAEYALPADCIKVARVNAESYGNMPLREGGDAFGEGYETYGGKLVLLPAPSEPGERVVVRYLASHPVPVQDLDVLTVPSGDEDLLLAYAASQAIGMLATEEAKRAQFEARSGQAASIAAGLCLKLYEAGVRERSRTIKSRVLVAV